MANYIKSTNFTAKDTLPSGDAARIVKGTEIDVEFNAIASAVASKSDSNSPSFTGTPTAPTAVAGTNTTQIATTAFADAAAKAAFPVGGIILWSGSIAAIPATWQLCDGTNGTPNLRDRFIVGAGSTYAVGATGGSANAVVAAHSHTASSSVSDPGHNHSPTGARFVQTGGSVEFNGFGTGAAFSDEGISRSTVTGTRVTGISVSTTVASAGVSGVNANLPPYYALCYIMKVS
jgi:hypothetical protein